VLRHSALWANLKQPAEHFLPLSVVMLNVLVPIAETRCLTLKTGRIRDSPL
jgi:hypothetical protein